MNNTLNDGFLEERTLANVSKLEAEAKNCRNAYIQAEKVLEEYVASISKNVREKIQLLEY